MSQSEGASPASPQEEFAPCPFCAEPIRRQAVLCRFCQREVPQVGVADTGQPATPATAQISEPAPAAKDKKPKNPTNSLGTVIGCVVLGVIGWQMFLKEKPEEERAVPQFHLTEPDMNQMTKRGVKLGDWKWEKGDLKGKIKYNPEGAFTVQNVLPLFQLLGRGECYSAAGVKLGEVILSAPSTINAGETAEVTCIGLPKETTKVVVVWNWRAL